LRFGKGGAEVASKIFGLVVHFEGEIRKQTGVEVNLLHGPSKGKELGSAKKILLYLNGNMEEARALVSFFCTDEWAMQNQPTLAYLYSQIDKFRVRFASHGRSPSSQQLPLPGGYVSRREEEERPGSYVDRGKDIVL
jgi:hypothetical protein